MKMLPIRALALLSVLSAFAAHAQDAAVVEPPAVIEPPTVAPAPPSTEQPAPIAPPVEGSAPLATDVPPSSVPVAPGATGATDASAVATSSGNINDFQGDEVGTVLRLLARQASINLVVSDKVTGTVTMRLVGKTPLEAIKVVAKSKNLYVDEVEGDYYVKTQEEKAAEPTISDSYTFSYASAEKIAPLLNGQLASRAASQVDSRTNTIFFRETESGMENARAFLKQVDSPTQQVMIEARLVEVTANPAQAYGINWSGVVGGINSPQTFRYAGSDPGELGKLNDPDDDEAPELVFDETTGQMRGRDFFGKPGGSNPFDGVYRTIAGQFAIMSAPQLALSMRLINQDGDAEFLANPRIVTANNQSAKIKITRNQPVPQLNFNEQTATAVFGGFEDKEFGNTLEVIPQINKDNFITLGVKPEISNKVGDATFTFAGATVASPIIDKRSLDSNVLIKSGDTLAIGGLLQDEVGKQRTKVPVAGDIPILGYLFQERVNIRNKRNLLIFVTPTIIKQGYATGLESQVSGLDYTGEEYADPNGWRNNAKGAIRLVPTSNRSVAADYPKPGAVPQQQKSSKFKTNAAARER